jgi:centromeric protein E
MFKGRIDRNAPTSKDTASESPAKPLMVALERTVPPACPEKIDGELLKAHIEVCARIRPLQVEMDGQGYFASKPASGLRLMSGIKIKMSERNQLRPEKADKTVAWNVSADGETAAQSPETELVQGRTHSYTLDHVYGPESTTTQLYQRSIKSLVDRAMDGYHSTIMAYGQTSTGKTFTMTGTRDSPGLIPMAIADCFRYVKRSQESREYLIRISYLEVYKEVIRDLLNPSVQPVRLFDGPDGLIIRGIKEEIVSSPEHVYSILTKGERRRQVGATQMNQHSSRSHVMVRLWIESTGGTGVENRGAARVSSLSLVDLAGSESVRLNGADRREEGQYINKSLMTLGQVVLCLSEGKTGHIPYRDSKLTRLLQPSLSGNAQMVLLCCISPQTSHVEESHNTFKFATRAKKVEQKAIVNVADDDQTLLQVYKSEIDDLRKQLAEARAQQGELGEKPTSTSDDTATVTETTDGEIQELVEAINTMERLILKSKPHQELRQSASVDDDLDMMLADKSVEGDDDDDDELLIDLPVRTPTGSPDGDALHKELSRIRGLLGSVLEKRGVSSVSPAKRLDFATPPRTPPEEEREVATLRKQLEEQEMTANLKKADASFLQKELNEKVLLLEEVSKVLDALEERQNQLEAENAALKVSLRELMEVQATCNQLVI